MGVVLDILGWAFIVAGSFFCVVGAIGMVRMPDLYTRIHATGVIDPFGVVLILVGLMFQAGFSLNLAKLAVLVVLLLFTSPVACHAVGRAAFHRGLEPQLAEKEAEPSKP